VFASALSAALFVSAGYFTSAVALVAARGTRWILPWRAAALVLAAATVVTASLRYGAGLALCVTGALVVAATLAGSRAVDLTIAGRAALTSQALFAVSLLAWGAHYIVTIDVSVMTRSLMFLAAPLALISLPLVAVRTYEDWEVLCRARWHRPHVALELVSETWHQPWVSVHVPTHAEPPAVVIETLNRLAKLRYRQYEVIVLDNNTTDPALWQPVAEHCRRLGERFHFHHVEGLEGAKAGALNLALEYTDPRAELVAIVDADYHAEPNFLSNCTPFFDDRQMGFVQTPHAYRNWSGSVFQRMCNWEYTYFYKNTMVSLNERNAAITVGTMCVIRREALERAGGWAEWCLTEDSELAVRIHALGYSSIYLDEVYGRGLIPATFEGYRKQRFRWSYGPVQEFQRHWRLLVPGRGRVSSKLSVAQRVHHITHGLYGISLAAAATSIPLMVAVVASMSWHGEHLGLPFELWAAVTAGMITNYLHRYLVYRHIGATLAESVGAVVAGMALGVVIVTANMKAFLRRPATWQRTDKFGRQRRGWRAMRAVRVELTIAAVLIAAATIAGFAGSATGLSGMLVVGLALQAAIVLTSPLMVLLAERDLRHVPRHSSTQASAHIRPLPYRRVEVEASSR